MNEFLGREVRAGDPADLRGDTACQGQFGGIEDRGDFVAAARRHRIREAAK
jgi:hypothetical protein